uniref:Uncharacterized protein n=1 Tax=Schistocephalus solidus TaxID=70667 RepID=A0A0V0J6M1_SCHSO
MQSVYINILYCRCYTVLAALSSFNSYFSNHQQFLLTPLQFGIPNCRLRFYLVAKRRDSADSSFSFCGSLPVFEKATEVSDMLQLYEKAIIRLPPPDAPSLPNCGCAACTGKLKHISAPSEHFDEYLEFCRPLSDFLLPGDDLPVGLLIYLDIAARMSG